MTPDDNASFASSTSKNHCSCPCYHKGFNLQTYSWDGDQHEDGESSKYCLTGPHEAKVNVREIYTVEAGLLKTIMAYSIIYSFCHPDFSFYKYMHRLSSSFKFLREVSS